jgi:hypothetical protein
MNQERKIVVLGFAAYTIMMIVYYTRASQKGNDEAQKFDKIDDLYKILNSANFAGTWTKTMDQSNKYLRGRKGGAKCQFIELDLFEVDNALNFEQGSQIYMSLFLLDPEFMDERFLRIIRPITILEGGQISFKKRVEGEEVLPIMVFENYNSFVEIIPSNLTASILLNEEIFVPEGIDRTAFSSLPDAIRISIESKNPEDDLLNLKIVLSNKESNQLHKSIFYTYLLITVAFAGYISSSVIFDRIGENLNYTKRLSIGTIVVVCCQDWFIFLYNLQLGYMNLDSSSYILIVTSFFIVFIFFDYRLLLYVWRYQNNREFQNLDEQALHNKVCKFQVRIYLIIVTYTYLMWRFFIDVRFVFLNSFVLLPQIIKNIRDTAQPLFDTNYLLFFAVPKYLVFFYLRAYHGNILEIRYYYIWPWAGLVIIFISLLLIYHQENYGSKFFLPKIFKKGHFEYFVEMKELGKKQEALLGSGNAESERPLDADVCGICLSSIFYPGESKMENQEVEELQSNFIKRMIRRRGPRFLMRTPCNHVFHSSCLAHWMEIKMECPSCRAPLPELFN